MTHPAAPRPYDFAAPGRCTAMRTVEPDVTVPRDNENGPRAASTAGGQATPDGER
jgi:hypothetical protein